MLAGTWKRMPSAEAVPPRPQIWLSGRREAWLTSSITTAFSASSVSSQRWSGKFGRCDKWIIPPHRGLIAAERSEEHDETSTPDALTGLQGQGGGRGDQRRPDAIGTGAAIRHPPEPDHRLEGAVAGRRGGDVWCQPGRF